MKKLALLLVAAFAFAAVLGCGKSEKSAGAQGEYAVVLKTLSSPFWQGVRDGVLAKAKELGIKVDVYAANSEDDIEGQVSILENCISKGYKAIGVAPISPVNLNAAISQASKKGIYVVNIDEKVDLINLTSQGGSVQGFVATDNKAVGALAADFIVKQLSNGGEVAIIEGKSGNVSGEDRKSGAAKVFRATKNIKLVSSQPADWDRTKAFDLASSLITKYPNLKAIYACNDTMAMGALEAVKRAGKQIIVVGTDGNDDAIASVKAGELAATVAQDTNAIGGLGLQLLYDAYTNKAPIIAGANVPFKGAEAQLVTK